MEFVADRAGEFYCYRPIPGHRTLGMEGKFVVVGYPGTRPTNVPIPFSGDSQASNPFGYS